MRFTTVDFAGLSTVRIIPGIGFTVVIVVTVAFAEGLVCDVAVTLTTNTPEVAFVTLSKTVPVIPAPRLMLDVLNPALAFCGFAIARLKVSALVPVLFTVRT